MSSLVCLVGVNVASADMFYDANLVGFWQFSGDADDSSFYEHHGTLNGDADVGADILAVDGDGDYVEVQDDPDFRFTQRDSFSIAFWAKPDSNSQGYVLSKMRSGECYLRKFGYQVSSNDSRFHFIIEKSCTGNTTVSTSADSAPSGAWYHVVMVYDYNGGNKDMKAYLNGKLDGTGAFAYNTGSTTPEKALAIGARSYESTVTSYFDGQIDDVMIYDRALEAWEVRQLYNEANKAYAYLNNATTFETLVLPVKTTTGDPAGPVEGQIYVNTADNKVRVYADGAWRDLATW
ncbi:MAG: LamG domain-containing protein [Planctomycetota bacterium]